MRHASERSERSAVIDAGTVTAGATVRAGWEEAVGCARIKTERASSAGRGRNDPLDVAGPRGTVARSQLPAPTRRTLLRLASLRGGPEILEEAHGLGGRAVERATRRLTATYEALSARGVADRVSLDLGLLRDLGYYTGAILEVYDPALGHILGGGGRYDELMGRFGLPLPAAGFALYVERVHIAQAEEERLRRGGEAGS